MKELTDLLETGEKILWTKKLPAKNLVPNKSLFKFTFLGYGIVLIPAFIFMIIGWILQLSSKKWFQWYFAVDIAFTLVLPSVTYLIYQDIKNDYAYLSKFYSDEELTEFIPFYAVTSKHIVMKWISDIPYKFTDEQKEVTKNYAHFDKSVLFLKHEYLRAVQVRKLVKFHSVLLNFTGSGKKQPDLVVTRLTMDELEEFLKVTKSVKPDLKVINLIISIFSVSLC